MSNVPFSVSQVQKGEKMRLKENLVRTAAQTFSQELSLWTGPEQLNVSQFTPLLTFL